MQNTILPSGTHYVPYYCKKTKPIVEQQLRGVDVFDIDKIKKLKPTDEDRDKAKKLFECIMNEHFTNTEQNDGIVIRISPKKWGFPKTKEEPTPIAMTKEAFRELLKYLDKNCLDGNNKNDNYLNQYYEGLIKTSNHDKPNEEKFRAKESINALKSLIKG